MRRLAFLLCFSASLAPTLAAAFDMQMVKGSCKKLVIFGRDKTKSCAGKLINAVYENGRSGFWFVLARDRIVAFSGYSQKTVGDRSGADIRPIDRIIIQGPGMPADAPIPAAVGVCRMTNPDRGAIRVECKGMVDGAGVVEGAFVSDGSPPR